MTTEETKTILDAVNGLGVHLDKIDARLGDMSGQIVALTKAQEVMRQDMDVMRQDIAALMKAQGVMSGQIAALTKAYEVLRQDMDVMRQDIADLKNQVAALTKAQEVLTVHVSEALSRVGGLEKVVHAH